MTDRGAVMARRTPFDSVTHAQLRAAARIDAKTGPLNATAWQPEADREIARVDVTTGPSRC